MSTARHHAEWLSLVEASGPFLSLPVLLKVFPSGLDAHDSEHLKLLRLAYEEWQDNQLGARPEKAIHRAWVEFVLRQTLELPDEVFLEGQRISPGLQVTVEQHGEILRPDWVIVNPQGTSNAGTPRLLVQIVPAQQDLEKALAGQRWKASPATRMMELLHAANVRLGLVTNGEHWMLVNAPRGETTGFISWYATLWLEEHLTLRAFRSLLGVRRFFGVDDSETLETLLTQSITDQQEVTDQLGYQVRRAVEVLVQALDRIDQDRNRSLLENISETQLYEAALTVMMRLVFLFAAEERKLIPSPGGETLYQEYYAVSTIAAKLRSDADKFGEEVLERRSDAWCRLLATFRAVFGGIRHDLLDVPAYGGSLFDPDRFPFLEGRALGTEWKKASAEPIPVNNRIVLHLLEALQILQIRVGGTVEPRRISFRALDIEQIGHVYEGLLDHTAVRASSPVLGLIGTREREPEITLAELERLQAQGEENLVKTLKEQSNKSPAALKKALSAEILPRMQERLRVACNNDGELYQRVLPFAGLIRLDTLDYPVVIPTGSVYVTQGTNRRETGTHYTPRSLTEPIVQYTLEPLVYEGVAQGKPKSEWVLKSAQDLLLLKVCDMAMGSGAFLVQTCRYLAERLVEAWETAERENPGKVVIAPEGTLSQFRPDECPIPKDSDERLTVARRIVAERCLYGVDKNPLAVEMAKLSLWLITLAQGRPFTFLNHALKWGDSLLGITRQEQIEYLHLNPDKEAVQLEFALQIWRPVLQDAITKRRELESFSVNGIQDLQEKERLFEESEQAIERLRFVGDYLIGRALADAGKTADLTTEELMVVSQRIEQELAGTATVQQTRGITALKASTQRILNLGNPENQPPRKPFHWLLEFPEVFLQGDAPRGFSAIVGNPPFLGNKYWSEVIGRDFHKFTVNYITGKTGKPDLCAIFFKRTESLAADKSYVGLIGCESLREGDSQKIALERIVKTGKIFRAHSSLPWLGSATVRICIIWFTNSQMLSQIFLDTQPVAEISPYLTPNIIKNPQILIQSSLWASEGTHNARGDAFILKQGDKWLEQLREANSPFCRQYVTADDMVSHGFQKCERWIIDTQTFSLEEIESICPKTYRFLDEVVKPVRTPDFLASYPGLLDRWWQVWRPRADLYNRIRQHEFCIVIPVVSKYLLAAKVSSSWVFTNKYFVLPLDRSDLIATIMSSFSEVWIRTFSGTLGETMSVSLSKAVQTFPLRKNILEETSSLSTKVETLLKSIIQNSGQGYTFAYNRFHNPDQTAADIQQLRSLHIEMDNAVAAAYGWQDIDLGHDFHQTKQGLRFTISETARREVLDRLLLLNHERYDEEVAQGLHDKGKKKGKSGGKNAKKQVSSEGQLSLF